MPTARRTPIKQNRAPAATAPDAPRTISERPVTQWLAGPGMAWMALGLAMMLIFFVRWRLIDMPLDRDEGEYAYVAQQMLRGVPPYVSGYTMKMPGIYACYAASMLVLGETIRGLRAGALVVTMASTLVIFLIAGRLFNRWTGAAAAVVFALLSLDPTMHGLSAQAEHFCLLPLLLGVWALVTLYDRIDRSPALPRSQWLARLFVVGLCFGTAVIIKQHSFPFALFAAYYVAYRWWRDASRQFSSLVASCAALAAGLLVPPLCVLVAMRLAGVGEAFWFWTITYARQYITSLPLAIGLAELRDVGSRVLQSYPLIWTAAAIGLVALLVAKDDRRRRGLLLPLAVCSLWSLSLGLYFREHYFLFLLPVVSLLAARACELIARLVMAAVQTKPPREARATTVALALLLAVVGVMGQRFYFWQASTEQILRQLYGGNPFPESVEIARYLDGRMQAADSLMIFGSEPQIYFYLGRRAASPHIYMYPLAEPHAFALEMQNELTAQMEAAPPDWIIYEPHNSAWLWRPEGNRQIIDWMEALIRQDYVLTGIVDILGQRTNYVWDEQVAQYPPRSSAAVFVFRNNEEQSRDGGP